MADRIIPLNPGPKATLGPSFNIEIERPRDKTALNDNPEFIRVRHDIIEYLMDANNESGYGKSGEYILPKLSPVTPGSSWRRIRKKAA
jgi:nitrate/nitrite transport system ATP-binding protein